MCGRMDIWSRLSENLVVDTSKLEAARCRHLRRLSRNGACPRRQIVIARDWVNPAALRKITCLFNGLKWRMINDKQSGNSPYGW
jgi:hypothetical protein